MAMQLADDGTLDTVFRCTECGGEERYTYAEFSDGFEEGTPEERYDEFREWAYQDAQEQHECEEEERFTCDSCQVVTINGRPCHETGCRNAWINPRTGRGYPALCWNCGCDFIPEERPHRYSLCEACVEDREE